jgi:NTE family protein
MWYFFLFSNNISNLILPMCSRLINCKKIALSLVFILLFGNLVFSEGLDSKSNSKRPKVGLVLSGGGAKGFAYVGLLKVIQEAGLRIDYIGGSSIGSIVGGLYAIGYSPDTIAKMIRSQNWDHVLKDVVDRKYIAYEEKEYNENAIITIPVKNKKVSISPSLYSGQEVNLLLNKYFSPAYKTHDFKKFQTPFLCIGTDLINGHQVVLDNGYLPMAIRSSMSIPGYFSPSEYNGHTLVDGGVVNNYPVKEVMDMGAEIIVGGDVQSGLYSKEKLTSITSILDQVMSFHRVEKNIIGDSLTDIHVRIKMEYGMMDFQNYDSIISVGEAVARQYYPAIKRLADSLNAIEPLPLKTYHARPLDSIFIDDLVIEGNHRMPTGFIKAFLPKMDHRWVSLTDIENAIHRIYGTSFFEHVFYELKYENNRTTLVINAQDESPGEFSAAIHYDNDYNGSIIINSAFRNLLGNRSKLFADLILGVNPRLRALYLLGVADKSGLGVGVDFYSFEFSDYDKDIKINKLVFTNYKASVFYNRTFNNMYGLKVGLDYEYFRFKQDVVTDTTLENYNQFVSYGTLFASVGIDTRDRQNFSTRGTNMMMRAEWVMPWSKRDWVKDLFSNSAVFWVKYDQSISLSKKLVFRPGIFAGGILKSGNSPPVQHLFAFGGLNPVNYIDQYVDFTGVKFIQEFGYYAALARVKLQYNVFKNIYLTVRSDIGSNELELEDAFKSSNVLAGYGATASYDSFIGPIELSVMGSNINPGVMLFINIGFWF